MLRVVRAGSGASNSRLPAASVSQQRAPVCKATSHSEGYVELERAAPPDVRRFR